MDAKSITLLVICVFFIVGFISGQGGLHHFSQFLQAVVEVLNKALEWILHVVAFVIDMQYIHDARDPATVSPTHRLLGNISHLNVALADLFIWRPVLLLYIASYRLAYYSLPVLWAEAAEDGPQAQETEENDPQPPEALNDELQPSVDTAIQPTISSGAINDELQPPAESPTQPTISSSATNDELQPSAGSPIQPTTSNSAEGNPNTLVQCKFPVGDRTCRKTFRVAQHEIADEKKLYCHVHKKKILQQEAE